MSLQTAAVKIRAWMKKNDCDSLRKAGPKLGLHYTQLGRLLTGKGNPTSASLEKVAGNMGITIAELLADDPGAQLVS